MIAYVGIDAHTTNYTLATRMEGSKEPINVNTYSPAVSNIVKYCKAIRKEYGKDTEIVLGYEAGCLGFKLRRDLEQNDLKCIILAPTSIPGTEQNRKRKKKTDKRDAEAIAKALINSDYSEVYMPDEEDEAVRDYIRMREDHRKQLRVIKQQISALTNRHGFKFTEGKNYWTQKHLKWLKGLPIEGIGKETIDSYLLSYETVSDRIAQMDKKIEEIAEQDRYREAVHRLICFKGVKTLTALAVIVEIGDFTRFVKAKNFAAFLGLVSEELSSSDDQNRLPITKQGNRFIWKLLVECSQSFSKATSGKSALLKKRQEGNTAEVIIYADKANERLRKRYLTLILRNKKPHNKAVTAVARELACFIWGMMTGNIHTALA
ncbi:MAG: IS110 family transposase [Erysipelotrichaceae bacterium]|nr:IS110 family transposase [Erysipelotrichaceae bacterium]